MIKKVYSYHWAWIAPALWYLLILVYLSFFGSSSISTLYLVDLNLAVGMSTILILQIDQQRPRWSRFNASWKLPSYSTALGVFCLGIGTAILGHELHYIGVYFGELHQWLITKTAETDRDPWMLFTFTCVIAPLCECLIFHTVIQKNVRFFSTQRRMAYVLVLGAFLTWLSKEIQF